MPNFFSTQCKEAARTDLRFGLIDDKAKHPMAFSTTSNEKDWTAIVDNSKGKEVSFIAIDQCLEILDEQTNEQESLCDGMLLFEDSIFLIELFARDKAKNAEAEEQLKNTIRLLQYHHEPLPKYKKAFICNQKHKRFQNIENAHQKRFVNETSFRLDINQTIKIK